MQGPSRFRTNGHAVSRNLNPILIRTDGLRPLGRQTRHHSKRQVEKIAACLDEFGFVLPILVDPETRVIAGWALVLAARRLGLPEVPVVTITDLDEPRLRGLRLALNRLGEDSSWDGDALRLEFSDILRLDGNILSARLTTRKTKCRRSTNHCRRSR